MVTEGLSLNVFVVVSELQPQNKKNNIVLLHTIMNRVYQASHQVASNYTVIQKNLFYSPKSTSRAKRRLSACTIEYPSSVDI